MRGGRMSGEKNLQQKIRNWFILFLLTILIVGSFQLLLGQTKIEENKVTEKEKCSAECHKKSGQTKKGENVMGEEKKYSEEECHKKFAVQLNNLVWTLLERKDRSKDEDEKMIHAAHASLFHWGEIGKAVNLQRGQWLVSHVYAVLNRPEPALYHAQRCMELTEAHNFLDFDLAYAYEAMARAYAVSGNKSECEKYIKLAKESGEKIKKKEDKKLFFSDFEKGPWYKMK